MYSFYFSRFQIVRSSTPCLLITFSVNFIVVNFCIFTDTYISTFESDTFSIKYFVKLKKMCYFRAVIESIPLIIFRKKVFSIA